MRKYCQMTTKDGLEECGFLVGARCVYDRKNPFTIDRRFHDQLKVVGCASWSKYLDYDGRERETDPVPELQDAGLDRGGDSRKRDETVPMPQLQAGDLRQGNSHDGRPAGDDMKGKKVCFICGAAGAVEHEGKMFCLRHHISWCRCIPIKKMMDENQTTLGELKYDTGERK